MIHDYIVDFCGGGVMVSDEVRYLVAMFVMMFAIEGIVSIVKEVIARTVGGGKL